MANRKANGILTIWTIFNHPRDYPDKWVVRGHDIGPGMSSESRPHCFVVDSLEEAHGVIPQGCVMMRRHPEDDPIICEVWL